MSEVQPDSPQGIYDTLLELRLQNWAHEKDPQVRTGKAGAVLGERPFFHLLWLPFAAFFRPVTRHPWGLSGPP